MSTLKGKTTLITGGSRGIGLAIALRYAAAGANVVIVTKDSLTVIEEAAHQITAAGGHPFTLLVDVSDYSALQTAIAQTVERFGGIDVLVNNTSATCFTDTLHTLPKQFDLAFATSARAAFFLSQLCVPHLEKASNPHIVNISPPLHMDPRGFKDHLAFSLSKYAMSLCTLGMAAEFKEKGIGVNSLWPETTIATQTIKDHFSKKVYTASRWPSIMGDAAYELILHPSRECSGQFFTDEALLKKVGVVDFSHYAVDPHVTLMQSLFVPIHPERASVSEDLFLINH